MPLFQAQGARSFNPNGGGTYYDSRLTAVLNTATYEQFIQCDEDDDDDDISGITYEAAENTFWTLYNAQAETIDSGIITRWRGNMDSILIFAGLFSAVLTAFIAEALQFDTMTDTTPVSAIIGTCIWFVSLGFSLVAALGAIIIQQWSRSYEMKTQHQGAPKDCVINRIQAHQWAHKVNMDRFVSFVPKLLHVSLLLFYAGSVPFFKQFNVAILILNIVALGVITFIYALLVFRFTPQLKSYDVKPSTRLTKAHHTFHTNGYQPGSDNGIDNHMTAVGELVVKLVLYQTIRENSLEDFLCVLHVLINHERRDTSNDSILFSILSLFSRSDLLRELISNARHWLRTYNDDGLSLYEMEKRIKACGVIAPLYVIGLSTRTMDPAIRKQTASACLEILKSCKKGGSTLYHRISSVELVVKSAMALGWRGKKEVPNLWRELNPNQRFYAAIYLLDSIHPIDVTGAPHLANASIDNKECAYYCRTVLLFLLALYHVKAETGNLLSLGLWSFNLSGERALRVTNRTVDVFLLKGLISDMLDHWDTHCALDLSDDANIVEDIKQIYNGPGMKISGRSGLLDATSVIRVVEQELWQGVPLPDKRRAPGATGEKGNKNWQYYLGMAVAAIDGTAGQAGVTYSGSRHSDGKESCEVEKA